MKFKLDTLRHPQLSICIATLTLLSILPYTFADQNADSQKTCLWRIESGNTTAYLQGSIHLLSKDSYPLPPQIEKAFKASEQIVLEMDLAAMNDPITQIEILRNGMLPKGQTLNDMLSPETLELANKCCSEIHMNLIAFQRYKPWMMLMVLTATKLQQIGFSPENGLDFHFYNRAVKLKKKVIGLETMNEQLALFDSIMDRDQNLFMKQGLEDFMTIDKDIDKIIKTWRLGDIEQLDEILLKNMHKYPDLHETLILNRNNKWMTTIDEVMKSGTTTMIIVGAGHLSGKGGLVQILKDKKYRLKQL